jgi:hypothetical protein
VGAFRGWRSSSGRVPWVEAIERARNDDFFVETPQNCPLDVPYPRFVPSGCA